MATTMAKLPRFGPPQPEDAPPDLSPIMMPEPRDTVLARLPVMAPPRVNPPTATQQLMNQDQAKLEKVHWAQEHPWGTAENHPGVAGKIAHVLSVAGNIAGNIVAPGVMANIPGTQLNMQDKEADLTKRIGAEEQQETENKAREAQTEHEQAATDTLRNPRDKYTTLETDQGEMRFNPATGEVEPLQVGGKTLQPPGKQGAPVLHETDQGLMLVDPSTHEVTPLTLNGKPLMPKVAQPTSDVASYIRDWMAAHKLEDTPENRQKAHQAYTQETKIQPVVVRNEGYKDSRFYDVLDSKNGNAPVKISAADLGEANLREPGRYISSAGGAKALGQTALIEDIRGNINQVRDVLNNPKMPEFSADQRAALAFSLGGQNPGQGVLDAMARGGALGSLTPEQQDYAIAMAQLKENAMAMRSVLGAGQGSDELRAAITATLPGPRNPSKGYGLKQLTAFESVLNRLERGVPKVQLGGSTGNNAPPQGADVKVKGNDGKTYWGNSKTKEVYGEAR